MLRPFLIAAALVLAAVSPAAAQNVNPGLVTACVQSQQQAMTAVDAANRRIELARQTNQPAAMRAAMDDLQLTLSSMRTQLAPCATLQAAAAPQAPAAAGSTAGSRPPAAQARPVAPPPHADHVVPSAAPSSPELGGNLPTGPDKLACTTTVDPKTAPRAAYAGKTYYFCSITERDRFVKDPAAYRPK